MVDRYRAAIAVLLGVVFGLALVNAARFPPSGGYDAVDHIAYADELVRHGRIPGGPGSGEYYSPPLFYAAAGVLDRLGDAVGLGEPHRLVLGLNALVQLATALLLLALARELWPERRVLHVAALGFFAFLPVTTRLAAMFHPEPLDLLAVTASLYLCARLLRHTRPPLRDAALLGLVLGLALLVRQFAAYGAGAVGIALLVARHYRALAVAAGVAVLVAAPWYVRQALRYSNPVFAETPTVQKPLYRRRPASFYLDPGLPQVFSAPWRPHFVNRAVPTTYSELWGDYFGVWVWKGRGEPAPNARRQLRLQNVLGLLPTLLAVGGWIALLRRRGRSLVVALVPLLGLVGYAYFTIGYPTRDGDVLKASYMLTTATAWALAFGYAVDRLARRRALAWALAALLIAAALVELPFLLY